MNDLEFKPMEDAESAINIGGLSIENASAAVLVTGAVELKRDTVSLERAQKLSEVFAQIANKLARDIEAGLTSELVDEDAVTEISNPF